MMSGWRLVSLAAILGLLGSAVAGAALADVQPGSAVIKHPDLGAGSVQPVSPPGNVTADAGVLLLQEAAAACQSTSYRGEQVVLWWGQGETSSSVVQVWHQPGGVTLVRASGGGPGTVGSGGRAGAGHQDPAGILGVSDRLLALLEANYRVFYAGRGWADSRSALVVEVRRPTGALAARFWLDAATKLPLRREIFDGNARMISEDTFTRLDLGPGGLGGMPAPAAAPWTAQLDGPRLTALRAQGWPLPARMPGNLVLFAATQTSASSGQVVDVSYSDGLDVVSLFVQRGELAQPMPGWRQIAVDGRTVYSVNPDERTFAWSANGYVYTMIADAPMTTVRQVVTAMPGQAPLGFWQRIARGFHRLASWLNPLH